MIRFIKELYLTAFTVLYRRAADKKTTYKAGTATATITLIEWLNLVDILCWIGILNGEKLITHFSIEICLAWIPIGILNTYFLYTNGHGLRFESKFDKLEKSRKTLLKICCAVLLVATIVFTIYSFAAYRHFIQEMKATNGKLISN